MKTLIVEDDFTSRLLLHEFLNWRARAILLRPAFPIFEQGI